MAEFLAHRIMERKMAFKRVPGSLKDKVKAILEKEGFGYLAEE